MTLQRLAQECNGDSNCTAFNLLDQGCCSNATKPVGFLKRPPFPTAIPQCAHVSPFSRLYVSPSRLEGPGQGGTDVGAIVGGRMESFLPSPTALLACAALSSALSTLAEQAMPSRRYIWALPGCVCTLNQSCADLQIGGQVCGISIVACTIA